MLIITPIGKYLAQSGSFLMDNQRVCTICQGVSDNLRRYYDEEVCPECVRLFGLLEDEERP